MGSYIGFIYEISKDSFLPATVVGLANSLIVLHSERKSLELKLMIAKGIQGKFTSNENKYSSKENS